MKGVIVLSTFILLLAQVFAIFVQSIFVSIIFIIFKWYFTIDNFKHVSFYLISILLTFIMVLLNGQHITFNNIGYYTSTLLLTMYFIGVINTCYLKIKNHIKINRLNINKNNQNTSKDNQTQNTNKDNTNKDNQNKKN